MTRYQAFGQQLTLIEAHLRIKAIDESEPWRVTSSEKQEGKEQKS